MGLYFFCASFGLLLAYASFYFTRLQRTDAARFRPPSRALTCLLWLFFSLLIYACAKDAPAFNLHVLANALAALGCGIAMCAFGTVFAVASAHPGWDPRKTSWGSNLRSINVPYLLMLCVLFTGLIYHRWFK